MNDGQVRGFLSRRGFLRLGAGFVVVAGVAAGLSAYSLLHERPSGSGRAVFDDDEAAVLRALAEAYFPDGNALGAHASAVDVVAGVDAYAARLLPRERKLMRVLVRAVEAWPRLSLTSTRPFSRLSVDERVAVLARFERSSLQERRLLATLLRSLIGMVLFDDPRFLAAISHQHGCGLPIVPDDGVPA